jgi:anti-sigma factor RsiW
VKCSEFLNELNQYLDGDIDANTRLELEEHLHWCKDCYVVCDTTKKTIEIYRHNELFSLPEKLRSRLQDAIRSKCQAHKAEKTRSS